MKHHVALLAASLAAFSLPAADAFEDRFVWVFGWGLGSEKNVQEIGRVLQTAGKARLNGAVVSFGLDTLCKQSADFFARLAVVQNICRTNDLELIPAVFSIGYGGGALAHDRNLAEGVLVQDAPFTVAGGAAAFAGPGSSLLTNGGFESFSGNKAAGFNLQEQPGEISFIDQETKLSGKASLRFQNFGPTPHGHARAMKTVPVTPHRCYRVTFWVKTEGLQPVSSFRSIVLAKERSLAPREFAIPATTDWRKVSYLFNSMEQTQVNIYAGLWGGKAGKIWLDDWSVEEVGPVNVLSRPGTPVIVRSEDGAITYEEGKDYMPLRDPQLQPFRDNKAALTLKLSAGARIRDGQRLRVSWYHSMLINDSQVTVCMAEPAVYEIFDHEAKLLADALKPRAVFLNMDEVRMGGTCRACAGRDMAQLLGECVTRQAATLRRHIPGVRVYVWSDMFDPNHNAKDQYYLVQGSYAGSWKHIPRDLVIAVWGGAPRPESLRFFSGEKFSTLVACYYDAADLSDVRGWLSEARKNQGVRGFMYTPWLRKYELLPEFGRLLRE